MSKSKTVLEMTAAGLDAPWEITASEYRFWLYRSCMFRRRITQPPEYLNEEPDYGDDHNEEPEDIAGQQNI